MSAQLRQAAQAALEALENFDRFRRIMTDGPDESDKLLAEDYAEAAFVKGNLTVPILRAALAEPQPEPVAWMPIIGTPFGVRMNVLNQRQAQKNHSQSLEMLADRGGLSMDEAAAVAEMRGYKRQNTDDAAKAIAALAAPKAQQPLAREQIDRIWSAQGSFTDRESDYRCFARAIELAHRIGKP